MPPGQLADALHLLRLQQLLLSLLARSHLDQKLAGALLDALLQRAREVRQRRPLDRQFMQQALPLDLEVLARRDVGGHAGERGDLA